MALSAAWDQRVEREAKKAERVRARAEERERRGLPPEPEQDRERQREGCGPGLGRWVKAGGPQCAAHRLYPSIGTIREFPLTNTVRAWLHACMPSPQPGNALRRRSGSTSDVSRKEPLQVRIPTSVKRCFKAHAAMRGLEPNELFVEVWEHYERTFAAATSGDTSQ